MFNTAAATAKIGIGLFSMLANGAKGEQSLIQATKGARFEPIVLVDSDLLFYDNTEPIMQSLSGIFTGYLMQAIALYGRVNGVKVIKELDKFNPSREPDWLGAAERLYNYATEDNTIGLPTPKGSLALESLGTAARENMSNARRVALEDISARTNKDMQEDLAKAANLSIGRIVSVDFGGGKEKYTVPVIIRLLAVSVPSSKLAHILVKDAGKLTDIKDRWYAWKSGRLNFISDLIFCRDLIKQHRKDLMEDKDGVYSTLLNRRISNSVAGSISGQPSIGGASNMALISSDTASEMESIFNGKLSNFATRQRVFDDTGLMILVVVDKEFDRVTFYHEGMSESTQLSIREIKANNKGQGPDVTEMLKAYAMGNSPL